MKRQRLFYLDMAKGIGIFLVVLGHLQGDYFFSLSPVFAPFCAWIFSFHMPLFFVISGMLIRYREDENRDWRALLSGRFRSLMVPYLWFSLIYLLIVVFALIKGTVSADTLFEQIWYILSLYGMNVLWFLPALFFGELLFLLILKKTSAKITGPVVLILTVLAELAVYGIRRASLPARPFELLTTLLRPFFVCTFIACGYYFFALLKQREKISFAELGAGAGLMLLNIFLHPMNAAVDFRSMVHGNPLLYYLCALAASFGLVLITKNLPPFRPVVFYGAHSLVVMAVHNNETVLYQAMRLALYLNQFVTKARGYISYAVIVFVMTLYTVILIFVIDRWFGFLIGKPSPFDPFLKRIRSVFTNRKPT